MLWKFICAACGHEWETSAALAKGGQHQCPLCGRDKVHRIDAGVRRHRGGEHGLQVDSFPAGS